MDMCLSLGQLSNVLRNKYFQTQKVNHIHLLFVFPKSRDPKSSTVGMVFFEIATEEDKEHSHILVTKIPLFSV